MVYLNPFALRMAKIVYNFGPSERNRVKGLCLPQTWSGLHQLHLAAVREPHWLFPEQLDWLFPKKEKD